MTLPETHMRPVESVNAASKSRSIASTKSQKMGIMRNDRSSVTLAMQSELHGASVTQVPAHATKSRQSPTSTAQSRRPLFAASKFIKETHLAPVPAKTAAAGSMLTVLSGQAQLASTLQTPVNCRAERGRSYACACWRGGQVSLIGWARAPGILTYPH